MVKLPICTLCAKTSVLCPKCQEKLRSGKIDDVDMSIAGYIAKIERKHTKLKKARIRETLKMADTVILVTDRSFHEFWKENAKVRDELEKELGKKIVSIVKSRTLKATLQNIFSPLEIEGLDTTYLPMADTAQELKIRLRGDVKELELPAEMLKDIASKITGKLIRLELPDTESTDDTTKTAEPLY